MALSNGRVDNGICFVAKCCRRIVVQLWIEANQNLAYGYWIGAENACRMEQVLQQSCEDRAEISLSMVHTYAAALDYYKHGV